MPRPQLFALNPVEPLSVDEWEEETSLQAELCALCGSPSERSVCACCEQNLEASWRYAARGAE